MSFAAGCADVQCSDTAAFDEAVRVAAAAEQVVLMVGLDQGIENEGRDRADTRLPGHQPALMQAVVAATRAARIPLAVVLVNGGIVSTDDLVDAPAVALVEAWYPGRQGGAALADALFGATNRWGKLPVTVYASSFSRQVRMTDMAIAPIAGSSTARGRTYKYWRGDAPLFTFGHGLSYTQFKLVWGDGGAPPPTVWSSVADSTHLSVGVSNTGTRSGDEVVLIYHIPIDVRGALTPLPQRRLVAYRRLGAVLPGDTVRASFNITAPLLALVDNSGDTVLLPGAHVLHIDRGHGAALTLNVTIVADAPIVIDTLVD